MNDFYLGVLKHLLKACEFISNWLPTYFVLYGLLITLLAKIIFREISRKKASWLSNKVEQEKCKLRKLSKLPIKEKILTWFSQLYYPTVGRALLLSLILAGAVTFLTNRLWIPYTSLESDFYKSLVPITIGIVALVFPVMIFIIGFSGNKLGLGVNLSEVLLRESYLFPVGLIGLFFLVDLILVRSTCVIVIQIILSAVLYTFVLFRIVRILLNDHRLLQKSKELLRDKMKRSIEMTISERVGNNILLQNIGENKIELEYSILDLTKKGESYIKFSLRRRGIIQDINMDNLDKISKIIERSGQRKNMSFYKNVLKSSGSGEDASEVKILDASQKLVGFKEDKERYLRKRFMDSVTDDDPCILCVKKEAIFDKATEDEIRSLIQKTFVVKTDEQSGDKLLVELRNLKDQLIEDIRNKRMGRIDSLKEIYISLAELFIEIMSAYSSNYTMEMARKERGNIIGEWSEVQWLTDDLRDIYEIAMQSGDRNIIREIGFLPIAIGNRAIPAMDHYIFEKSFLFLDLFYMYAIREKDEELQAFMKERCGIYLRETADYRIQYELDKIDLGEDRIIQYRDFAIEIFIQLQRLLKQAYDAKDIATFKNFVSIGRKLFKQFHPSEDQPDIEHLKWLLKTQGLAQDEKDKILIQLKQKEFLVKIEQEIEDRKGEMFFGLASLILDEYKTNLLDQEKAEFFRSASSGLPNDLKSLTNIFLRCHDFKTEEFWGWHWWILPTDGEVHSIDFLGKAVWFYCVKGLQVADSMDNQKIENIDLPYNRDLVHMIEGDQSSIKETVNAILRDVDKRALILPSGVVSKKDSFLKVLDKAREKQIKAEEDFLITSKLNPDKIDEFIKGFFEGYEGNSGLHCLIKREGSYEDKIKDIYKGAVKSLGYNRLDEKGAFIDNWYVHYSRWGNQYGEGMASSENSFLFEKLTEGLKNLQILQQERLFDQIENAIQGLIKKGYHPNAIITSLDFDMLYSLRTNNNFIPRWSKECPQNTIPNFEGILKTKYGDFPTFRIFRQKAKGIIGIFDLKKMGKLIQYNPVDNIDEIKYIQKQFYIKIDDLNVSDKLRNEILTPSPEWLNKYEDKEKFLRSKVVVKTFMRFEYVIEDVEAGGILKISASQEDETTDTEDEVD